MHLQDFDYAYPKELIAQHPLPNRDASRMMVVDRANHTWQHTQIAQLPDLLQEGDLIVLNDSRVAPARLFGKRGTGEEVEVLVVEPAPVGVDLWRCLLRKAKRIRKGEHFFFGMHATATAKGRDDIYLLLEFKNNALALATEHHGVPPLPPYIEREGFEAYTEEDRERYQTVYARNPGSSAAPTAGLHLSRKLLQELTGKGIGIAHLTLHVGIDTFAPVRADEISDHRMHGERIEISEEHAHAIVQAKRAGRRVIAIGTTTTRALESAAHDIPGGEEKVLAFQDGHLRFGSWTAELFITPGFDFHIIDGLLTNFHQPKSTLLMMVAAFAGREFILDAYQEAIRSQYRLFSFGDCMLIV